MNLEGAILLKLREIREYIYSLELKYEDKDVRISFFDGYHEILRFYYNSLNYCKSDLYLQCQRSVYNNKNISDLDLQKNRQGFLNMLNSNYIISTWSNFELFITILCNSIFSEEVKSRLMNKDFYFINKELNDSLISEKNLNKLKKRFIKPFFARVDSNTKFNSLLSHLENLYSSRDIKSDREFLEFYGRLRNCIHSNYIFYGKDFTYTFGNVLFNFSDEKLLNMNPTTDDVFYKMSIELEDIVKFTISCITHNELIYDPTHELILQK